MPWQMKNGRRVWVDPNDPTGSTQQMEPLPSDPLKSPSDQQVLDQQTQQATQQAQKVEPPEMPV